MPNAQSAMEYLMTYGWAILVILIVLAVLYIIGVFNPNSVLGNQCNSKFHYSCTDLLLATNGTSSFLLGQNTGSNEYNVALACTAAMNSTGGPLPSDAWVYLNASGIPKQSYNSGSAYVLYSGTSLLVNNTPCYSDTGALLGTQPIGASFSGILWIRYTTSPGPEGGLNNWVNLQIATPYVSVGKSGGSSTVSASTTTGGTSTTTSTSTSSTTTISGTFLTGGGTGGINASASIAGTFSNYVCSGGDGVYPITSVNFTINYEDPYNNASVVGMGTHTCTVFNCIGGALSCAAYKTTVIAVAGIGMDGAPTPTIFNDPLIPRSNTYFGQLNYTINNNNSFVVIAASCGAAESCTLSYPSGCTQRQAITDGNGDTALIATCQSQVTGTYSVNITGHSLVAQVCIAPTIGAPMGSECQPASLAAYVYPNYSPTGT